MSAPEEKSDDLEMKTDVAEQSARSLARDGGRSVGAEPTVLSCPTCQGVLLRTGEAATLHFACQIGHAFSPLALVREHEESLQRMMESTVRSLRERAILLYMMADAARSRGAEARATALENQARLYEIIEAHARGFLKEATEADGVPREGHA